MEHTNDPLSNHLSKKTKSWKHGPTWVLTYEENAIIVPWILVMHKCVVDVKFNSCTIFHSMITIDLHFTCIFIVFALIFHIFNTTIHWNTKFMVISFNQNVPFKIHYKNSRNKITIHSIIYWCYKQFTQQYEHSIHYKSLYIFVLL